MVVTVLAAMLQACQAEWPEAVPLLRWYAFREPSGAFAEAAKRCSLAARNEYRIELVPLPADADQQREQLVRRLAAGDRDIDLIGMDVIWTAEFAEAGWILPWEPGLAAAVSQGRLAPAVASASYRNRLWGAPFTANAQILWYRRDRVPTPPATWDRLIDRAEAAGHPAAIQAQGERYEGLAVFFVSLLASAGGTVVDPQTASRVTLPEGPTRAALAVLKRLATSPAADPGLAAAREDQTRLAFETGGPEFMVNYSYVWPSALSNAPALAKVMGWARWPGVLEDRPGRVAIGGLNLGVSAHSRHASLAFRAAACLVSAESLKLVAARGGIPPAMEVLFDDPDLRRVFPFADLLRQSLRDAVQRPQSPVYNDISLAITRVLHPLRDIDPDRDIGRLRTAVRRALNSEGLL